MAEPASAAGLRSELTRGVGAWGAIAVNVANMIGTGVFLKTRVMTCNVGSADMVLLVWLAAGLLSATSAYAFPDNALNALLSFHAECLKQSGTFKQTKPLVFQCLASGGYQKTCDYTGVPSCKSSTPLKKP